VSPAEYLWNYILYFGADTDINTAVDFGEKNKTTAIVVRLIETLLNKGHTVWMGSYYNSPDLAAFLKKHGTNVAGTLHLKRKNMPPTVKNSKLKRGR
jgi:arginase family enzyme